jgi:surfactin synthase thioesterase subunit
MIPNLPHRKIQFFLLPFAGGNRYSYRPFDSFKPDTITLQPLEFSGHITRIGSPLYSDIHLVVDDLFEQIKNSINQPYALFGHSMGALAGTLLCKKLIAEKLPLPIHLFVSGRGGPAKAYSRTDHLLPRIQFIKKLQELGGIPNTILEDPVAMALFEPILRADFQAVETYVYEKLPPADIPITVLMGNDDRFTHEEAELWQQETKYPITIHNFKGDHFFIFNNEKEIMTLIGEKLNTQIKAHLYR